MKKVFGFHLTFSRHGKAQTSLLIRISENAGNILLATAAMFFCIIGCSNDTDNKGQQPDIPADTTAVAPGNPPYSMEGFARGADISWITEMEMAGKRFYDKDGKQRECLELMRVLGVNSIRLRVWVNPADGFNGKQDVIAKALRAKALGFRLMIDFHYSDTWADPGHQNPPAAWADYDLKKMKEALSTHTSDVLGVLKEKGIDVEWVQVGNETPDGMLHPIGIVSSSVNGKNSFTNFIQLVNSGYDAVKAVYPDAKVIVHVDQGQNLGRFTWMFDGLRAGGAKWDIIGMSLYPGNPDGSDWETCAASCLENVRTLAERYGKEVMICEIGMPWDSKYAKQFVSKMLKDGKAIDKCLGVFYWEPQCYSWKGYTKGAFDLSGKPTSVFDAYREQASATTEKQH